MTPDYMDYSGNYIKTKEGVFAGASRDRLASVAACKLAVAEETLDRWACYHQGSQEDEDYEIGWSSMV
jgi:hypothetical protein